MASPDWQLVPGAHGYVCPHFALYPPSHAKQPRFRHEPTHLFIPFVLFATWRALDGALRGKIKQHQRWVMGLFFGALVINGVNNIFFLRGAMHEVFFGR